MTLKTNSIRSPCKSTTKQKTLSQRLEKDYLAAAQAESTLKGLYDQQTREAYALNRKTAEYALLKDQGDSSRNLYNILQTKLAQAGVNAGLGSVNALIMDKASLPSFPVEPQKPLTLALGLIMGLVTGVCSAFLGAANESNVESIDQIEAVLGLPTLALVPQFTKEELTRSDASLLSSAEQSFAVALRLPRSRAAEAYRTLRNAVLLTGLEEAIKTFTFTSALPGEGKSTSAVNFAIVLAQKGSRVLLVDADLRRPSLSRIFKLRTLPGLSTCLLNEAAPDVILSPISSIPNLFFCPAGPLLPSPSEALGSTRLFEYLERWRAEYDYVIFDCAPVLGISDSIPLASWSDSVLLVAHFGTTPIKAMQRARDVLLRANARIPGCILNGATWASRDYYLDTYSKKLQRLLCINTKATMYKPETFMHQTISTTASVVQRHRHLSHALLAALILTTALLTSQNLPAQTPTAQTERTPPPQSQSESSPVSNGDLLDVKVFNAPELSGTARVNEKGEILLPVTGTVVVAGLAPDQASIAIQKAIHDRQIMEEPSVTVLVTEYSTQMVTVAGEVKSPGVYSLIGRHDLYYVPFRRWGAPTPNQGSTITLTHKRDPNHPETIAVNTPNYSSNEQQTVISPGDTVMVSRAGMFYVVGDVAKSGAFYIQNGEPVSILNALALAGSTNFTAASKLSLIRKNAGQTEVIPINVKEIATARSADLTLRDGDILFVPGSTWKRITQAAIPGLATSLAGASMSVGVLH